MEYIAVLGQYIHIALGLQYITYHHGMEYIVLAVPLIRPRSGIQGYNYFCTDYRYKYLPIFAVSESDLYLCISVNGLRNRLVPVHVWRVHPATDPLDSLLWKRLLTEPGSGK